MVWPLRSTMVPCRSTSLDAASYERFTALAPETFRQVSDRTGIPLELLTAIREAIGMASPSPDDRLREDEMAIVPFIKLQVAEGFRPAAIERLLRVHGDSTRRMTEQEAAWWNSEVIQRAMAAGKGPEGIANVELADRSAPLAEQAVLAMYHMLQARAWTANIIEGFETLMEKAGIHSRLERLPAICFLDISGYTRLTQERDAAERARLAAHGRRRNRPHPGEPERDPEELSPAGEPAQKDHRAGWPPSDPDPERHVEWVRRAWEDLRPHSTGVRVNFLSDEGAAGSTRRTGYGWGA